MADVDRKLMMLAERGTRIGPEEMVERVRAELAGDPLVVRQRRKGSGMLPDTTYPWPFLERAIRHRVAVGVATFVAVLALGGGVLLSTSGLEPEIDAANPGAALLAPVEEMLDAFFDHDPSFIEYFADSADPHAKWDFTEWAFGLGVKGEYDCSSDANGPVLCDITTQNRLAELAGISPAQGRLSFTVERGEIVYATDIHFYLPEGDAWGALVESYGEWLYETKPDVWASTFQEGCDMETDQDCMYVSFLTTWTASRETGEVMVALANEFLESGYGS